MDRTWSRRRFLVVAANAGLGLSSLSLWGCRANAGAGAGTSVSAPPADSPPVDSPPDDAIGSGDTVGGGADYKALVCVFLAGGNDAYNMLVPRSSSAYARYSAARLNLAVPQNQLLDVSGVADDGIAYGLHPSCPELQELFNNGRAALMANVGSLTQEGTRRGDYLAGLVPPRLFSHSDQQDQWHTAHPDAMDSTGWAGRAADVLAATPAGGAGQLPINISLAGSNLLQRGHQVSALTLGSGGAQQLNSLAAGGGNAALRAAFDAIRGQGSSHVFESTASDILDRGIRLNELVDAQPAPELATPFPADNALADQLQRVAKLIGIRQGLGMSRQIFFVSLGGWDTHDRQLVTHPALLTQLSQALKAFHDATLELGVADRVTTFTMSDFGRSLTVNGKGTDHGWSSHHWVIGGGVRGGTIYGRPPSLAPDSSDDTRGGRFIPTTAVDQYGATLVKWLGVEDAALDTVFPNLARFSRRDLGFMA